jgi:hypothetical protein
LKNEIKDCRMEKLDEMKRLRSDVKDFSQGGYFRIVPAAVACIIYINFLATTQSNVNDENEIAATQLPTTEIDAHQLPTDSTPAIINTNEENEDSGIKYINNSSSS